MPRKKILFITPYTGIAGAEMYLLRVLQNINKTEYECAVYSENKPALYQQMTSNIKYFSYKMSWSFNIIRLFFTILAIFNKEKFSKHEISLRMVNNVFHADLWVINSIKPFYAQKLARKLKIQCVTLIHEMPESFHLIPARGVNDIFRYSDFLWCCSERLKTSLESIGFSNVLVQHYLHEQFPALSSNKRQLLLDKFNIKSNTFCCIGAGTISQNKNVHFFCALAKYFRNEDIKFIWLGRKNQSGYCKYIELLKESLQLNNLILADEQFDDYSGYLSLGSVFLMPSYIESFSIVTLEALSLGIPAIAYACGGVSDLITESNGVILDSFRIDAWAQEILKIKNHMDTYSATSIKDSVSGFDKTRQCHLFHQKLETIFLSQRTNTP
jgi:glycosyltransferase involved in cell wall biosynthesis